MEIEKKKSEETSGEGTNGQDESIVDRSTRDVNNLPGRFVGEG